MKLLSQLLSLSLMLMGVCMPLKGSHIISAELEEELSEQPLSVQGSIPTWLSGILFRNGPVKVSIDGKSPDHWFDGLAMLHAFHFQNGQVAYTNKFLRTDAYRKVFEDKSLDYTGFAIDPCRSRFRRFLTWLFTTPTYLENANINIAKLADQYVALQELPLPVRFDPTTLETLGVLDYKDKLTRNCWESAHPHYDPAKKETLNYLIDYGLLSSAYTFYRLPDGSDTREVVAKVTVERPAYMHSFAMTENYIILTEFPLVVRPLQLLLNGVAFIKNFTWQPELGTQFIVIDRSTGKEVLRSTTKPFFAFHHVNAFEIENKIVLDIVTYEDASVVTSIAQFHADSKHAETFRPHRLQRFTLSLNGGEIQQETLCERSLELPRINSLYNGRPYTYAYLSDLRELDEEDDIRSICKVNTKTKEILQWEQKGCSPGEPLFVPTPNAQDEDDGVVLAVVLDEFQKASFLLVLDAKNLRELGRAKIAHRIPPGLHGQYY